MLHSQPCAHGLRRDIRVLVPAFILDGHFEFCQDGPYVAAPLWSRRLFAVPGSAYGQKGILMIPVNQKEKVDAVDPTCLSPESPGSRSDQD